MRHLLLPICLIALALAVPVVPFVGFGPQLEAWLESAVRGTVGPRAAAALIVGLLSVDVFLPIPSSVLSTLGGEVLGFLPGTAASFAGLMLGSVVGFGFGRIAGRPLVRRFAAAEDLQRVDRLSRTMGAAVLAVSRPVPILAEAAVLFFGATGLSWRKFAASVAAVNLLIAAAYSALGHWVHLPAALIVAVVVPVVATLVARRALNARRESSEMA